MANSNEVKQSSSFVRMISVLLGVFGAGWLFNDGWQGVFDFITSYKITENFFHHFFNTGLFPVLTLAISLLFLITSLKDLESLSKGFGIFTVTLSCIVFAVYVFRFVSMITEGFEFNPAFLIVVGQFFLIIAYFTFSMYVITASKIKKLSWSIAIISLGTILVAIIWGYVVKSITATSFIKYIFTILSHLAIFWCELRK